ncbi:MAG: diadenylate cyclase CdaA [Lachnospiraceae bacterium]|nr:diadenylate cyclase CdaA [Lachnospiraceae bacterium]
MLNNLFPFLNHTVAIGPFTITFSLSGIIEAILFSVLVYYVIVWIKRTKAWNLLKGAAVLAIVYLLAALLGLNNFTFIFKTLFSSIIIAAIVIFQPEIRRALEQLGENNLFRKVFAKVDSDSGSSGLNADSVDAIVYAMGTLARNKTGALVLIERKIDLKEYVETGIALDARISAALLEQIFEHNTPLHDGAVVIRKNRIVAATCYLPLSKNQAISKELGTRHRAGLGISEVSDCITLIASEETGHLSVAENGVLKRNISADELRELLTGSRLGNPDESGREKRSARRWKRRQPK